MADDLTALRETKDWARRPWRSLVWWGLPVALGLASNLFNLSQRGDAAIWTVALAWAGLGCVLNASRCHRLHCYISAPALLLGSFGAGLIASGVLDFGPQSLNAVIGGALVVTLVSFAPELAWGRYANGSSAAR
jgi:hypothetical protein